MDKDRLIGVDLGGTNTKIALITKKARILSKRSFPTQKYSDKNALLNEIVRQVGLLLCDNGVDKKRVLGIGIGAPGLIDFENGIVHQLINVRGWKEVPLAGILQKKLGIDCYVDNDVNVMALGELYFGAAKGARNILCVTLGTGVGGGVIIEGRLYRGSSYSAGEIGHIGINEKGPRCNCGNYGCVEAYVGANYIVRDAVKRLKKGEKSILRRLSGHDLSKVTPELIDIAARKNDSFAVGIWEAAGFHLGSVFAGVANLMNFEKIIIGGGISKACDILYRSINRTIKERAMKVPASILKVQKSALGYDAGVVGGAALVLDSKKKR